MPMLVNLIADIFGLVMYLMNADTDEFGFDEGWFNIADSAHNAYWNDLISSDELNSGQTSLAYIALDAGQEYLEDVGGTGFSPYDYKEAVGNAAEGMHGALSQSIDEASLTIAHNLTDSVQGVAKFARLPG